MKKAVILSCLAAISVIAAEKTTRRITYSPSDVQVSGALAYGETSGAVSYTARPVYRAFVFAGFRGQKVEVTVNGTRAFVALADSSLQEVASGTSSLSLALPDRGPHEDVWYIIFRTTDGKPGNFTVQVKKTPAVQMAAVGQ